VQRLALLRAKLDGVVRGHHVAEIGQRDIEAVRHDVGNGVQFRDIDVAVEHDAVVVLIDAVPVEFHRPLAAQHWLRSREHGGGWALGEQRSQSFDVVVAGEVSGEVAGVRTVVRDADDAVGKRGLPGQ